jgi:hypothetical protein
MNRFFLPVLIISLLLGLSCSSRKNRLDRRNMIPEKELIKILTDTYIADGLLSIPTIHSWYTTIDSSFTYNKVIEQHGYTKATMDKTMKYYFIKRPKKLIEIYDRVLGNLTEMESLVEKELQLTLSQTSEFWNGKSSYILPDPAGNDSTVIDLNISTPGFYRLNYTAIVFPADEMENPRFFGYTCHSDSIESGKRDYLNPVAYIKDGLPHTYSMKIYVPYYRPLHLKGWLIDSFIHSGSLEKHAIIDKISLTFSTAPV